MEGRKILNAVCCFIGHRDVRKTADVQMRLKEMIDRSEICVFYYDSSYEPIKRGRGSKNSGTRLAYEYATKRRKRVINIISESN